jgi:phage portal protein BeeE
MGLLEKVAAARGRKEWSEPPFWDAERLRYPLWGSSSLTAERETIENDFAGYIEGVYKRSGPVFALMAVRQMVFSEARFQFRRLRNGRPGDLFGTQALGLLERPWEGGTTGDLLGRMLQDADLAGNAYLTVLDGRIRRMRPDWVTIITESASEPELFGAALDARITGYLYEPQGVQGRGAVLLTPERVAHFAPIPDPDSNWRGMSWISPVLREVSADSAATTHKLKFFENGASPQVIVSYDASITPEKFEKFKQIIDRDHKGPENAYRTLHLGAGADPKVVGADLKQLDFKATQGAGETRLAAAAGVPPVIVGFSEGLAGSSLNEGNFKAARRRFADGTLRPLWRNAAGSLAKLLDVPADAELWYDERDISFLREDRGDAAQIQASKATTIRQLVDAGYTPESVIAAVEGDDFSLLVHSGLFSVQLQAAGAVSPPVPEPSPAEEQ